MVTSGPDTRPLEAEDARPALLAALPQESPDIFSQLITAARADDRPGKIDLGVGIYIDEDGRCPIMEAVARAERAVVESAASKSYLPMSGDAAFCDSLGSRVFGLAYTPGAFAACHTPGGSGALSVAAAVLAEQTKPGASLWLPDPTWPNHAPLAGRPEWRMASYAFTDPATGLFSVHTATTALAAAMPDDIVLLQASCHNPCGIDPTDEDFYRFAEFLADRKLFALIDTAYLGFGQSFDADCGRLRALNRILPEFIAAISCSKTFGLYSDRVGAAFFKIQRPEYASKVLSACIRAVRRSYSMPPSHGAAVIRTVLNSPDLHLLWQDELEAWRTRITMHRHALAEELRRLGHDRVARTIVGQIGMFSALGLNEQVIGTLQQDGALYLGPNGRINFAGLSAKNIERAAHLLSPYLSRG